ncbi:uncharacterized protein LOC134212229 [Armigeres subalbatus]|uniref:uncharacterized protein LOC134212229 n=1 Tax=Armigeres subalbatus TaxID=124917 RepID=UPI002ED2E2AA
MDESHHRSIMDHLEMGTSGHHLQEDLSKGVLRTIHNVENGTLHFITIPPASNSREQEYIESSLLGADLLSSHLPNGMLVDYIGNTGSSTPSNQYHQQTTSLLDHHNSIQTYTAEDLQTLVDASNLQTSDNERKLFLQFVNKPTTQISHEAPVIVTNPKDLSAVSSLTEHDKLSQSAHSQPQLTSVNHMSVPVSGNSFIHYHHQDQLLSTTHSNVATNSAWQNQSSIRLDHHPHQIIQNTAQLQQQQTLSQPHQTQQQSNQQQLLSSIHPMLQNDCNPAKLFHVSSSAPINNNISTTNQTCITIPPLAPIKRVESPKRYITYQMAPPQTSTLVRPSSDIISTEGFLSREDLIECDPRSDEDEDQEPSVTNASNSHFMNNYLPHKKRLAKTLGDPKTTNPPDQFLRNSVISNDHQNLQSDTPVKEKSKPFACQLCSESFDDQLIFFTHLKGHYEPSADSPSNEGKNTDPKKKPKLPRVKHTKKLKNDKSSRVVVDEESRRTSLQAENQTALDSQAANPADNSGGVYQPAQLNTDVSINHQQQPSVLTSCAADADTAGEFSETEDMLEGIRNVVQKVQDVVDTDTNDGLGLTVVDRHHKILPSSANTIDNKTWFHPQHRPTPMPAQSNAPKPADFGNALDTQEIHINTGGDNFVLFLNKADFQEQDMLENSNNHRIPHQHNTARHEQHILPSSHDPPTSYILEADHSLQPTSIGECDMNSIQILDLGSNDIENHEIAKLVDFELTTPPHVNDLHGDKLFKGGRKTSVVVNNEAEFDDEHGTDDFYLNNEEAIGEDAVSDYQEEPLDNGNQFEAVGNVNDVSVITVSSAPPGKKKGRKKANTNGNEADETVNDGDGSKKSSKKYPCAEPDCDKVFNSKTAVRYHELQHKNERPFNCSECPKNFFTSSALKVHERLHSGEKPYKCDECGRAFRQWGDMKYHQSSIHSNEKTHQCEFCGKKFARRYSLVLHRKIHLNEKNHVCDICNKAFRASSYLQSHRMIHTGEKPYSCTFCVKKFRCGGDMKRHLKTHERSKSGVPISTKTTVQLDKETSPNKANTKAAKRQPTDVIDLTKIKNEGSKNWTQPVITVLSKDINHAAGGSGSRINSTNSATTGPLTYLTQVAGDQLRKPEETVLITDITRW